MRFEAIKISLKFSKGECSSNLRPLTAFFYWFIDRIDWLLSFQNP